MSKTVVIVGSGFGGLGVAALLAKDGYEVTVLEKNNRLGGRAGVLEENGYRFDMGPSWYLMPDVFEHFFELMGEHIEDHLTLTKLSPSYRIFFEGEATPVDMEADPEKTAALFESLEPGAGKKFIEYLARTKYQYDIAVHEFMYKNYDSVLDFFNRRTLTEGRKLSVFATMDAYVRKWFSSEKIRKILEYQLVFLGSSPYETPALYSVMNHIDFNMGVYYPEGGIGQIVKALVNIGTKHGVTYRMNAPVSRIRVENGEAVGVTLENGTELDADIVISNADRAHTELSLLSDSSREHGEKYWKTRTLAPSAFILYLGVDGTTDSLAHHTLYFSKDWKQNFDEIFKTPGLPQDPSFYVCRPSLTDTTVAPPGKENLFVLVPIGAGREYTPEELDAYETKTLEALETKLNIPNLRSRIEYKRRYTPADFVADYNSLGGTGLGLAHTLMQTAIFRPNNVSKKVKNLYYTGAGTNPGIGMPVCLISAELAYKRIKGITTPEPLPTAAK